MNFPTIATPRLQLVQIMPQHVKDIFELFSDSEVTRFYNLLLFVSQTQAADAISRLQTNFDAGKGIRWGICLHGSDAIIGTIGFNNFQKNHRANIGYDLRPAYWNKGYISEAISSVVRYGFVTLEVNRIEAEVMQGNQSSERVLQKYGFKKEGVLRQWMLWNDRHYDMSMFAILKSDFDTSSAIKEVV